VECGRGDVGQAMLVHGLLHQKRLVRWSRMD
jgi:hypothetical protein